MAAIPPAERATLIALYNQTNGNGWIQNTNWCDGACPKTGTPTFNAPGTECRISGTTNTGWDGIECDEMQTHVVSISAIDNNLAGPLPSLTALTNLTQFYAYNQCCGHISGSLPSLAGMTNLQYFEVDGNELSGSIPDLSSLTALESFSASQNQLTGSLPNLAGLTNLGGFDVAENQLTGSIPAFAGLSVLGIFYVNNNQLTGTIPDMTGLVNLSNFDVSHNQLSGNIPDMPGSIRLNSIDLAWNQFTGPVPNLSGNFQSGASILCPNTLSTSPSSNDAGWDLATGYTPWWANPYPSNQCDDLFTNQFEF